VSFPDLVSMMVAHDLEHEAALRAHQG